MSQQSFADLGVSDAVVRALAARGVTAPFDVQRSVVPDVLAGHDVLVQSPTGSGKTLAFGVPLVDRVQAEDARAAALVLVPDARAREPGRRGPARDRRGARAVAGGRLRRRRHRAPGEACPKGAHPGGHTRPPGGPRAARRHPTRFRPRAGARRGRPDARHGLPPGRRPHRRRSRPSDRQTLFFSATLEGATGQRRRRLHAQRRAATSSSASERAKGRVEHRFVAVAHESKLDSLVNELRHRRARPHARVRAHEARRRPPREAPQRAPAVTRLLAMHGNKTQSQREKALARFTAGNARHARGHRCGSARHRRRRHHARDQLRPARGPRRLRAPRGPYRQGRARRDRHHAGDRRAEQGRRQDRLRAAPARPVRAERHERGRRAHAQPPERRRSAQHRQASAASRQRYAPLVAWLARASRARRARPCRSRRAVDQLQRLGGLARAGSARRRSAARSRRRRAR